MSRRPGFLWSLLYCLAISLCGAILAPLGPRAAVPVSIEKFGEMLFSDVNLSKNRTQACATCHDPEHGFADPRETGFGRAVSMGDDGRSVGRRNAPSIAYAQFSPTFHKVKDGVYAGGQFWDGRALSLEEQVKGPLLSATEMGLPNAATVLARLKENTNYVAALRELFGVDVLEKPDRTLTAVTKSLAAFERTATVAPFDSKYDRYLRGEVKLSDQEELGRVLFFSPQFANCSQCHKLKELGGASGETFSDYEFHNIGVPENPALATAGSTKTQRIDRGLLDNPTIKDRAQDGKFKVPSLRNVAVTAPYMHNGVFKELRTAVRFYNKYNSRNPLRQINPETNADWGAPEVAANISLDKLKMGKDLPDVRTDALVAFLKTLTDKRYEPLLKE